MSPKAASARTVLAGNPIQKEAPAAEALSPGQLIQYSGATDGSVEAHDSADGTAQKMWVRERDVYGKDRSETIPLGDNVMFVVARSGDEILALLADGETVSIGTALTSDGAGSLKVAAGTAPNRIVAFSLEDLANTSGDPVDLKVEAA